LSVTFQSVSSLDDGGGGNGLILDQQRRHQRCLLRVALLKQRPAPPWLRDIVDGDKKVDYQRLPDEVGEEVGNKERSGGGWGGMNQRCIFTSLHGQRGAVMQQRGRGSA
jgi:hypothetical protein